MRSHCDFRPGSPEISEAAAHLGDSVNCISVFSPGPATGHRHYAAPERQPLLLGKSKTFVREFNHSCRISVPLIDRRRARERECFTLGMRSFNSQTKKFFRMSEGLLRIAKYPQSKGKKNFSIHSLFMSVSPCQHAVFCGRIERRALPQISERVLEIAHPKERTAQH